MRKRSALCILAVAACVLGACTESEVSKMNEEQKDAVAQYAGDLVLKYDKNYYDKYEALEETTEELTFAPEETYTEPATEPSTNENGETDQASTTEKESKKEEPLEIGKMIGLPDGVQVKPVGFGITSVYPANEEEALFVMKPTQNKKLLVVKLAMTNTTDKKVSVNTMANTPKFRAIVNDGSEKLSAQLTLLLDGFNTFDDTLKPSETKKLVLIFQTDLQNTSQVNNLKLGVICGDKNGLFELK